MKNIDYRLDLFNAVENYNNNIDIENDALFIICHNKETGDAMTSFLGDEIILSQMLTVKGYCNIEKSDKKKFDSMQNMILNIAYNILLENKDKAKIFLKELK